MFGNRSVGGGGGVYESCYSRHYIRSVCRSASRSLRTERGSRRTRRRAAARTAAVAAAPSPGTAAAVVGSTAPRSPAPPGPDRGTAAAPCPAVGASETQGLILR